MSKLTEAYIRQKMPKAKKIQDTHFRYADLGNCYSYVEFGATVDGEYWNKQMKLKEFFEWIGENILNKLNK